MINIVELRFTHIGGFGNKVLKRRMVVGELVFKRVEGPDIHLLIIPTRDEDLVST